MYYPKAGVWQKLPSFFGLAAKSWLPTFFRNFLCKFFRQPGPWVSGCEEPCCNWICVKFY